jgi:hypothetical protein
VLCWVKASTGGRVTAASAGAAGEDMQTVAATPAMAGTAVADAGGILIRGGFLWRPKGLLPVQDAPGRDSQ